MNRILGFTGTREGMSKVQAQTLYALLTALGRGDHTFHHGMCVGADTEAERIVLLAHPTCWVIGHPPENKRLFSDSRLTHEVLPAKAYLVRNHEIVSAAELLIAAPKEGQEPETAARGQGTWSTVRFARAEHKPIYVVWPDGRLTVELPKL